MCVRWGRAQKKADKPGSGCDVVIASQPTGRQCGVYCLHERRTCFGVCGAVKQHVPCAVYRRVPESVCSVPAVQRDAAPFREWQMRVLEQGGGLESRVCVHIVCALHAEYGDISAFALAEAVHREVRRVAARVVVTCSQFGCYSRVLGHAMGICDLVVGPSGYFLLGNGVGQLLPV